jgi:4-amino-4-deoxy-L-arabinose transferase-like glycosyltransferase
MLFITLWHVRRRKVWLVLSGIFLGLSTMTKIFTGLLAPIFLIGLLAGEYPHLKKDRDWRLFLEPAVIWGLSFSVVLVITVLVFVKIENLPQLIAPHLSAGTIDVFQGSDYTLWPHIRAVPGLMILALMGLFLGVWRRSWLTLYPGAWMVTAFILLSLHSPVWSHQQLLVTIPAAIMAAIAVGDSARFLFLKLREGGADWLAISLRVIPVILFVRVFALYFPKVISEFDLDPQVGMRETSAEMAVLSKMNDYVDETHWIVTDMPILAFWLQKPVPPELAVFTSKRLLTGNLTEQTVINAIITYKPEQVMLGRYKMDSVREYLDENYRRVYDKNQYVLYVRPDLTGGE